MGWVIRTGTKVTTPPTVSSFKGSGLYQPRLGLEMEMVVADAATGASLPVQAYFDALLDIKRARGQACEPNFLEDRCVSVQTPLAECGPDNGFNLMETTLAPLTGGQGGLRRLDRVASREFADSMQATLETGPRRLHAVNHPARPRVNRA